MQVGATVVVALGMFAPNASAEQDFGIKPTRANEALAKRLTEKLRGDDAAAVWKGYSKKERRLVELYVTPLPTPPVTVEAVTEAFAGPQSAGPALAEPCPGDDQSAPTWEPCKQYVPEVTADFDAGEVPTEAGVASTCKYATKNYGTSPKNMFGTVMFSYSVRPNWCYSKEAVTSFTSNLQHTERWFWEFRDHVYHRFVQNFRPPSSSVVMYEAKGEFKLCTWVPGCTRTAYPVVQVTVERSRAIYHAHTNPPEWFVCPQPFAC